MPLLACCRALLVRGAWTWSSWGACSPVSPSSTPNGCQPSDSRPDLRAADASIDDGGAPLLHRAEAHPTRLLLTDVDVRELVCRDEYSAATAVSQIEDRGRVVGASLDECGDIVWRQVGLDHQLACDTLDSDLDLHADLRVRADWLLADRR